MVDEVSGLENPMLSKEYGSGTCQKPCEVLSEDGKGDEVSFGSYSLVEIRPSDNESLTMVEDDSIYVAAAFCNITLPHPSLKQ